MKKGIIKLAFIASLVASLFYGIDKAMADDPLKYPPFSWPSDQPEKAPSSGGRKDSVKSRKPDIYQNRDATKQWYDGDFLGMDDD